MKKLQRRATFEDVGNAQDIVLDFIDECIKENRPLNVDERKFFIENLRLATLGLTTEYGFIMDGKNKKYDLKHVGHAACWLAYRQDNPVKLGDEFINISEFWKKLRDMLFLIFPHAIETSIKISREQKFTGAGGGHFVGPKSRSNG